MGTRLKIGFVAVDKKSSLAFPVPRVLKQTRALPLGDRAVQACPAVNTFERRCIEILAPFSIRLRCVATQEERINLHVVDSGTRIDPELVGSFVSLMPRSTWRSSKIPVVQIALPHFFICDETCYVTQTPPWASVNGVSYPGQFISGRFPTHVWPRTLNLAFEWSNLSEDFRMKRGQPVSYLLVEGADPERQIDLVEAIMTEDLQNYVKGIEGVVKFTSGSFSLFSRASEIRPPKLLFEK